MRREFSIHNQQLMREISRQYEATRPRHQVKAMVESLEKTQFQAKSSKRHSI